MSEMENKDIAPSRDFHTFQARGSDWVSRVLGEEVLRDGQERNHQFLIRAIGVARATGCSASELHQLVEYVFNHDPKPLNESVGGTVHTLAALCETQELSMIHEAETELQRVGTIETEVRFRQLARRKIKPIEERHYHKVVRSSLKLLQTMEGSLKVPTGRNTLSMFYRQKLAALQLAILAIHTAAKNGLLKNQ